MLGYRPRKSDDDLMTRFESKCVAQERRFEAWEQMLDDLEMLERLHRSLWRLLPGEEAGGE